MRSLFKTFTCKNNQYKSHTETWQNPQTQTNKHEGARLEVADTTNNPPQIKSRQLAQYLITIARCPRRGCCYWRLFDDLFFFRLIEFLNPSQRMVLCGSMSSLCRRFDGFSGVGVTGFGSGISIAYIYPNNTKCSLTPDLKLYLT